MPNREVHKLISKLITGYDCEKTHAIIDWPTKYLGRNHRVLFHDPISASLIGYFCDGPEGTISGLAHIVTDYLITKYTKNIR